MSSSSQNNDDLHAEILKQYHKNDPLIFILPTGEIEELNHPAEILLGSSTASLCDKNILWLLQTFGPPPDDFTTPASFEALVNKWDGSVLPAQIEVMPIGSTRALILIRDLTLRNRLRDQLIQERVLLRTLIDTIPDRIYIKDTQGRYILNNQSHLHWLGVLRQEETIGKTIKDFVPSSKGDALHQKDIELLKSGQSTPPHEVDHGDGEWAENVKVPIRDPLSGGISALVGVSRDISSRKKAQERMQQSQRLESLGLLAGGIAHDFNNLLTVIIGLTETAEEDIKDLSTKIPQGAPNIKALQGVLSDVRRAGQKAAHLTQQLLAVGRQQLVEPEMLSLNSIVNDMEPVLRGLLKAKDKLDTNVPVFIKMNYSLQDDLASTRLDRSQACQILMNLVVNARDAIRLHAQTLPLESMYGGLIEVKTSNNFKNQTVIIEVSDNGCGMDESVRAKIFDPFFTTKQIGHGTGLGLASVYGILQQNKGFITVESSPGNGSIFRVELPSVVLDEGEGAPITNESVPHNRILLAEDDPLIRQLIRRNLINAGFDVTETSDGAQALKEFEKAKFAFDLIITDLLMPNLSGMELARHVIAVNPPQRILCISGYSNEDTGGLPLLHKPFTSQKLMEKIQSLGMVAPKTNND